MYCVWGAHRSVCYTPLKAGPQRESSVQFPASGITLLVQMGKAQHCRFWVPPLLTTHDGGFFTQLESLCLRLWASFVMWRDHPQGSM